MLKNGLSKRERRILSYYYVKFTSGDKRKIIYKSKSKEKARQKAEILSRRYIAKKKSGVITLSNISLLCGRPMEAQYELWKINRT